MQPGDPRMEAAGLLGSIGGLLSKRGTVVDVRPVVAEHSHEITALKVTTSAGQVLVVRVDPE